MAIYKLREVANVSKGSRQFTKRDISYDGIYNAVHYGKLYKFANKIINKWPYKYDGLKRVERTKVKNGDTLLINVSESREDIPVVVYWNHEEVGYVGDPILILKAKKDIILQKFLFYCMLNENYKKKLRGAANAITVFTLPNDFVENSSFPFEIPGLSDQQEIIDIIEHAESLFLKFNKCVRINTVENAKNDMKALIDIIEPIENIIDLLNSSLSTLLESVKNIKTSGKMKIKDMASLVKEKPKRINQVSAKILSKRNPLILGEELPNTYKTNSFFAPKGTLVINTIRTYLEKFGILYIDADVNGTLAQLKVEAEYEASVLRALLNDDFWSETVKMSHGTKMPVIKKSDILNIEINIVEPIENLFGTIASINSSIELYTDAKNKIISLLIK